MTVFNQPYIRDELTIDNKVQAYYDNCTGDGPVVLLGRIVKHAVTLRVYRQPLIIVADVYDGTDVQQLKSLVNNRVARLQALGGDGGLSTDPAPPAVGSLAFWGRGIGGDWEVSIPGSRLNADLNLSGLTEIQVWIGYRFLR